MLKPHRKKGVSMVDNLEFKNKLMYFVKFFKEDK